MFPTFKEYFLCEIADSRRNRDALINAYGLDNEQQAQDIIIKWNKYEHLIDPDPETYGFPRNIRNLNPKDIFAWSRATNSTGDTPSEANSHLMNMLATLQRAHAQRDRQKQGQDDYEVLYRSEDLQVYKPNSEGASCKLGAGTKWCTAATRSQNMFDDYKNNKGVTLYYFHTKHEGKYALAVFPDGQTEQFDEEDNQIRIDDLMRVVRDHGANLNEIIKLPTVFDTITALSEKYMQAVNQKHPDENEMLSMDELADDILHQARKAVAYKRSEYDEFRERTKMPDRAFLAHKGTYHYWSDSGGISERNGDDMVSPEAISFFMDPSLNPPGSMPDTNKEFQQQIESTALNHMDSVIKDLANYEPDEPFQSPDIKQQFVADIDNTLGKLGSSSDNNDQLSIYSKRHAGGDWKALHDITLDIVAEKPMEVVGNVVTVFLIMFTMREKGGRWKEFEQLVKGEIDAASRAGWNEQNHRILRLSEFYNRMVAGLTGQPDIVKYLPAYSDTIGAK
jgi:hypothetical protein